MAVDVGHLRRVVRVGRIINGVVADNEDHLRHFRTGNGCVRTEGAIGVALDYAQRRQHVHGILGLYIGLIRERRTGKHGERACERQHQCENLFLMARYCT